MNALSPEEIASVTGRQRASAQARVLKALSILFCFRPAGSILVLEESVHKVVTGKAESEVPAPEWKLDASRVFNRYKAGR